MTIAPKRSVSIWPVYDELVNPTARAEASVYIGEAHTFSAIRIRPDYFELYLHDERTPGGILINPEPVLIDYNNVSMTLDASNVLTIVQANGNTVTEDLTQLLGPDVHVASFTIVGNTIMITDTDANTFPLDLSTLAFVDAVTLVGNNLTFDFGDGSQTVIDLSSYVNLPPDGVVNSFTLSGNTATIGTTIGSTYSLDFSKFNETLADNGDGTYTFNDGEGNLVTVITAIPSAALVAGVDSFGTAYSIGDTIVTFPDGSVLVHSAGTIGAPALIVTEDNVVVEPAAAQLDFEGDDFAVTNPAVGVANIRRKGLFPLGSPIVFASSAVYTPTAANVAAINVEICGGGGGSAAAQTTAANQADVGAPGWGGAYCQKFIENPVGGTILIGAGGVGLATAVTGSATGGGVTRFIGSGAFMVAPGGYGGYRDASFVYERNRFIIRRVYQLGFSIIPSGGDVHQHPQRPGRATSMGSDVYGGGGFAADNGRGGDTPLGRGGGGHTEVRPAGLPISWPAEPGNFGYGGGAGGPLSMGVQAADIPGADGISGVCIIQEYVRV